MVEIMADHVEAIINGTKAKDLNAETYARYMAEYMPSTPVGNVDVATTIHLNNGKYTFDGNIGQLILGFEANYYWKSGLSKELALATAEYLLNAGRLNHMEEYEWFCKNYTGTFCPITVKYNFKQSIPI